MLFVATLSVACVLPLVFIYLKLSWDSEDKKLGLRGPPAKVLFGNSWDIINHVRKGGDVSQLFMEWCRKYGGSFRIRMLHKLVVFVGDATLFEEFMNNSKVHKAFSYRFYENWLGKSTVTSSGERWFKLRKLVTPAFHFQILEDFVKVFEEQGRTLVGRLEGTGGECVDVIPFIQNYTIDVIGETAMGIKLNAQMGDKTNETYTRACEEILSVIDTRIFNPCYSPDIIWNLSPGGRREKEVVGIIQAFVNRVIELRREELLKSTARADSSRRSALLDLLLNSSMDGEPLSDADIRGEVNTFMFAGYDTTTITTQFLLYRLARHQDIQARVFKEISETQESGQLCTRVINSLVYLDLCLKESLRLYPPVGIVGKETTEELKVGEMTIPAGTAIMPMFMPNHLNPKYFPEPEKFLPERFESEVSATDRHPYAYTPFSAGLRNCVGQRFGVLEVKTIVVSILRRFRVELGYPGFEPQIVYRGMLRSRNGVQLRFVPRATTLNA